MLLRPILSKCKLITEKRRYGYLQPQHAVRFENVGKIQVK